MLQTQRTFCDYLDGVKAELTRASALGVFEELGKNIQSAEVLKREIAEAELVVPVIGAFSAGVTMAEYPVKRPLARVPIHPGEILREEVLPSLALSVAEATQRLGVSRRALHRVLACTHPLTTEMALGIGKLVGNGPELWLRMQQACDLWHAEQRLQGELAEILPVGERIDQRPPGEEIALRKA